MNHTITWLKVIACFVCESEEEQEIHHKNWEALYSAKSRRQLIFKM